MSRPLDGIRVAVSLTAADAEAQIREKVRALGGEFQHALTPATDFLVCGRRWTEQYDLALRSGVTLVGQETFFDAHAQWVRGEELDFAAYFRSHPLLALENMVLCLSNMNSEQKMGFQNIIEAAGGRFSQALTQRSTLLVSPTNTGRKVDGARRWQIPVVVPKWIADSVKFGAALGPENYDPGNASATFEPPPKPAKTTKPDAAAPAAKPQLKRKVVPMGLLAKRLPSAIGATFSRPPGASIVSAIGSTSFSSSTSASASSTGAPATASPSGFFSSVKFSFVGFDARQVEILDRTVRSLQGQVDAERPDFVVVSSTRPATVTARGAKVVTEWGLERSLFLKRPELDSVWATPVFRQPCRGFGGLQISVSGFTDLNQRHVMLLVKLLGAELAETLTARRDLLVAQSAEAQKVRYAKAWGVPVVSPDWLWQCAQQGSILPIAAENCLDEKGFRPAPKPKEREPAKETNEPAKETSEPSAAADPSEAANPAEEVAEVRYEDGDAAKQAQILRAMGEKPPTPPPVEPPAPTMRAAIYSRLKRR